MGGLALGDGHVGLCQDHWDPCRPITFRVNVANAPGTALSEVRAALVRVSAQTGLEYRYLGGTGVTPRRTAFGDLNNPADTDLVLAWPRPVLAWPRPGDTPLLPAGQRDRRLVLSERPGQQRPRRDGDLRGVRRAQPLRLPRPAAGLRARSGIGYRGTRGQLLMHELAHTVGLGHTKATGQLMHPVMQSIPAVWGNGDAAGLTKVGVAGHQCLAGRFAAFGARATDGVLGGMGAPPLRRFRAAP